MTIAVEHNGPGSDRPRADAGGRKPLAAANVRREMLLVSDQGFSARTRLAAADLREGAALWKLCWTLGWLDIKGRYRGSFLGPLWLSLSTAVMVAALGVLYSTLFKQNLHEYLPFLALSLVLWNYIQTLVSEACVCFTSSDGMIRAIRMPFSLYAGRTVLRNVLVLLHNVIVLVGVYLIFSIWPGPIALVAIPALALWLVDSLALAIALGAFCARFRDIPPIVASVLQIAFFVSPIIWRPELIEHGRRWLPLNPFFSLFEIVRGPLLGEVPSWSVVAAALIYSAVVCGGSWILFTRVRGRLAFWV